MWALDHIVVNPPHVFTRTAGWFDEAAQTDLTLFARLVPQLTYGLAPYTWLVGVCLSSYGGTVFTSESLERGVIATMISSVL